MCRAHLPLLAMCSLGLALGSPSPMAAGWGLSQLGTRSAVERVCHTARRNSRLGFAVISYENKTKPNRLFAERKTSPHWGLMRLEVPVAEFPSAPDSTGLPLGPGAYMAQELMVSLAKHQDFPVI